MLLIRSEGIDVDYCVIGASPATIGERIGDWLDRLFVNFPQSFPIRWIRDRNPA